MRTLNAKVFILLLASVTTHVLAGSSSRATVEYVSDAWGTKWGVDQAATSKKKAELVAANPDRNPTSMRAQYMCYASTILTQRDLCLHVPMGPIGGFVRTKGSAANLEELSEKDNTCPDLTVVNLVKNAPGHKCGLKVGDVIYGVNGKAFTPIDWDPKAGRKGPFRELGLAIEDSEANRKGLVELMIRRGSEGMVIKVQLPPTGGLSSAYPFRCDKSMEYLEGICEYLAETQEQSGRWPGKYGHPGGSVAALALLGSGDRKYVSNVKRFVDWILKANWELNGWGGTWTADYMGVFLSEYYMTTGDKRVRPYLEMMIEKTTESMYNRMGNKDGAYYGTFGHYLNPDMDAQEKVYKMSVTTAGIAYFWAMASQAGLDVGTNFWDGVAYHINRATGKNGGMGYCGPGGGSGSHPGVANSMLALSCAPEDRRRDANLAKLETFLANKDNFGAVMINHGVTMTPFYRASIALYRTDRKAYREYMDYWKWFITLTRGPDNRAIYWDMSGGGGDGQLGTDTLMNGAVGIMLAAAKQRLFAYNDGDETKKETVASAARPARPEPVRTARKLTAENRAKLDNLVLTSLKKVNEAGQFKAIPLSMQFTQAKVTLKTVDDQSLTFQVAGGTRTAAVEWKNLPAADRATLALFLAAVRPDSGDLQALAGVCLEGLGRADAADKYYQKAGEASAAKLQKLFDGG